jgi:asparagine synthase (glutamine-hydrolysing)
VPYEGWLRGKLKREIENLLLSGRAISRGYFRKPKVERLLQSNSRYGKYAKEVFSLIALELWHQQFVDGPRPSPERFDTSEITLPVPVGSL